MLLAMAASVVLVITTILLLYEVLRLTSEHLAELPIPPRARILVVVLAAFVGHTAAVWIYAGAYWLLVLRLDNGAFAGVPVTTFQDCLYFSVVTYTTLGFGDHFPVGHARLVSGVEALNGLLLIGWSASFTYLAMERYWPLHGRDHAHRTASSKPHHAPNAPEAVTLLPACGRRVCGRSRRTSDRGLNSARGGRDRISSREDGGEPMRMFLVTFYTHVSDDTGHERHAIQHQVVVPATSSASAVAAGKALFCEASGVVDWRLRADACDAAEMLDELT